MREEIAAAVVFVTRLVKLNDGLSKEKVEEFSNTLSAIMVEKFKNHWYSEEPTKGQGYRCIRINPAEPIDPVLERAANMCGLYYHDLSLPQELTLWIDPHEVCCRFGESQGAFCNLAVLKDGSLENQAHTIDIADLVQRQQQRFNQNLNIVMTRTSASKLKAQAMKNATNFHFQLKNQQHNKHTHNFYNNQQQPGSSGQPSSRPFHKPPHKANNYHNFSQPPPGHPAAQHHKGHQGHKGSNFGNANAGNMNGNSQNFHPQHQNKDRFHWVRNKQHAAEKMRVSPS